MKPNNFAPLGVNLNILKLFLIIGLIASILFSFSFVVNYSNWKKSVSSITDDDIIDASLRSDCADLMDGSFTLFPVGIVGSLCFSIYHYAYLYQGSKSVYTLKRLPRKGEIIKRVFTLPVAAAIMFLVTGILLLLLYYGIYMLFTPEGWRNPSQLQIIWENLEWLI